ncbi:uncharacterized protein PHACADRAFT_251326 [Phanerochaete carnosa HHB-10118-sp]|uniref:Uncharacterized protein n=1 Tax=Phanerochaete carnosa (strain HHB-10118-sp) TaxID=650164 RepID=K5WE83_PHACS|nr:uncharacterized protein PHACADRAFT_251326 [Phanerochaete carnosa HHB-10118-sp]EKM57610.1 hypothetical protein PHACADRAFT_251326 [Phanerochaete carnosa HHB-10118-sp]
MTCTGTEAWRRNRRVSASRCTGCDGNAVACAPDDPISPQMSAGRSWPQLERPHRYDTVITLVLWKGSVAASRAYEKLDALQSTGTSVGVGRRTSIGGYGVRGLGCVSGQPVY